MKLVLDTSILIEHLRGGKKWRQILNELDTDVELFIPTIVLFELFSGKSSSKIEASRKIHNLIRNFQTIELDEKIAQKAGEIYRDITPDLEVPDYITAASALEIGGMVVTLNIRHFEEISGLSLYQISKSS